MSSATAMENSDLLRETEIVDFYQPLESEKNLYVSNIVVHLPEDEASAHVQEELHKAFSKFGLLYGVFVCASSHNVDINSSETAASNSNGSTTICEESSTSAEPYRCYVFVKFYSRLCSKRAKEQLHMTKIVGVKLCKIQYSRRKKSAGRPKQALFPNECSDVANYYLGFDGWSSAIKLMEQEIRPAESEREKESSTSGASASLSVCRFVCIVEVSFPRHGVMSHGVGIVEEPIGQDVNSKSGVYMRCRKKAHREAERNAFSRFLLVVVGNGKVHVELDPTLPDPVNTSGYLHDPSLIQVNELMEEPIESSSEDEDDDDSEMIQILAALQEENTMDSFTA